MADNGSAGLILDDIGITLEGHCLIRLSAQVEHGKTLTIMGPSGSGKSTFLAYIGGFLDPVFVGSGRALVDGIDLTALPAEERRAGILFQDPLLFPHMSVLANIAFAVPASVRSRAERRAIAEAALAEVGLQGFGNRDPGTLSGGQRARVALQRVLVSRPRLLLLDEPFSKLDAALRAQMRRLVFDTARAASLPVLLVTHDEADAEAAGGAVIRVEETGPVSEGGA